MAFPRWEAEQREGGCTRCRECEGAAVCCEVTELGQAAPKAVQPPSLGVPKPPGFRGDPAGQGWAALGQIGAVILGCAALA